MLLVQTLAATRPLILLHHHVQLVFRSHQLALHVELNTPHTRRLHLARLRLGGQAGDGVAGLLPQRCLTRSVQLLLLPCTLLLLLYRYDWDWLRTAA